MLRNTQNGKELSVEQRERLDKLKALVAEKLPDKAVDIVQTNIDESFKQEQYQDGKSSKWKGRKRDNEAGNERTARRALLVDSSRLIRSVEVNRRGEDIVVHTDTEYAQVHNEGLRAGRGAGFEMPQRQFMPEPGEENPEISKEIEKYLDDMMDSIFL